LPSAFISRTSTARKLDAAANAACPLSEEMTMTSSMPCRLPAAISAVAGACLVLAALASPASSAFAVGESSAIETCRKEQIWDAMQRDCIDLKGASVSDTNRARYAYALAEEGRFEEALQVLDTMVDSNTAEALNYRGYATRKLGRTDEGIGYYLKAIAMAPDYASVREYLGEAYLTKGQIDLAKEQLKIIEGICGTTCEEYLDLAEAIKNPPKS
jgi:pentatricopeptide repeat protein